MITQLYQEKAFFLLNTQFTRNKCNSQLYICTMFDQYCTDRNDSDEITLIQKINSCTQHITAMLYIKLTIDFKACDST